jgi:hypothetical protein
VNNASRGLAFCIGAALVSTSASAANLIENSDFNTGIDGWTVAAGDDGSASLDTTKGFPIPPSLHLVADGTLGDVSAESDCIAIDDSDNVDLFVAVNVAAGFGGATINAYDDGICSSALTPITADPLGVSGTWQTFALTDVALPDDTQSVKITLSATQGDGDDPGDALFDHVAFGPTGTARPQIPMAQEGLTGSWYYPQESGQGLQFQIVPDDDAPNEATLFGSWFTYDTTAGDEGSQRWYSMQGRVSSDSPGTANVTIYQNTGGNFNAPPVTSAVEVGAGILSFESCNDGGFEYALDDGRIGAIPIQRLLPNVECDPAGQPAIEPSDFGFSGTWYDSTLGGQGVMIEINPNDNIAFVGWYTYMADGEDAGPEGQRWFSAQESYSDPTSIDLEIFVSTGGVFDASDPVTTTLVGTATLSFQSCDAATFEYSFDDGEFDGESGTINLTRPLAAPESCSFPAPPPN